MYEPLLLWPSGVQLCNLIDRQMLQWHIWGKVDRREIFGTIRVAHHTPWSPEAKDDNHGDNHNSHGVHVIFTRRGRC